MTRSFHQFECEGELLSGSLDSGSESTGLMIVSGGNEIRSGAHSGMSKLALSIAANGFPVFRYDRRGIGESSGGNSEFLSSAADISAACQKFREIFPNIQKIIAFGNCDAATALALFGPAAGVDKYILANPWVMDTDQDNASSSHVPSAAAIRSRYWNRLKNPQSIIDLLKGKINVRKLATGLKRASKKQENSGLSIMLRDALRDLEEQADILIANRDTTALTFMGSWKTKDYELVRQRQNIILHEYESASHSFADRDSKKWLTARILGSLNSN